MGRASPSAGGPGAQVLGQGARVSTGLWELLCSPAVRGPGCMRATLGPPSTPRVRVAVAGSLRGWPRALARGGELGAAVDSSESQLGGPHSHPQTCLGD